MKVCTIGSLLQDGTNRLVSAGLENPLLDAQLLLGFLLHRDRASLILSKDQPVEEPLVAQYHDLIKRRMEREPLAYITGKKAFWKDEFWVTKDTLCPRPDTETLIEAILHLRKEKSQPTKILDLGTGSGCILLSLLREYPQATGFGVDKHLATCQVAKLNAHQLGLAHRAFFSVQYWSRGIKGPFDIIVSNPPYLNEQEAFSLEPEVSVYEPKRALYSQDRGLQSYRELAPELARCLEKEGIAVLEIGQGQETEVIDIMAMCGLTCIEQRKDIAGIIRSLSFKMQ